MGSVVLGIVIAPGQVAYLTPSVAVTEDLLGSLRESGIPIENRMRFACACREHQCRQWVNNSAENGRCGLVDRAVEALAIGDEPANLPNCGIRSHCRWFAQRQRKACLACPEILRQTAE